MDLFGHLTSSSLSPFSKSPHHQTRTQQLIRRFHRYHRLNLLLLLLLINLSLGIGFLFFIFQPSSTNILGATTAPTSPPPPSDLENARQYCRLQGGQVISQDLDVGQETHLCLLLDGTQCPVIEFFKTGSCLPPSPTPTPEPTRPAVYTPSSAPTPATRIYYLTLAQKSADIKAVESRLADYLANSLQINKENIHGLFFDTRQGSPFDEAHHKYEFSYYLVTPQTITTGSFENFAHHFTLKSVDTGLLPYLTDPQYCREDTDCIIRQNFCAHGAFNHFHAFQDGWVCTGSTDAQGLSLIAYDEIKQCHAQKEFHQPHCLNHTCTPALTTTNCISN